MARKTNKTAHVLNLITNPAPTDEDSSIEVASDILEENNTSEDITSPEVFTDKTATLSDPPSKTESPKSASNHPQSPVVEILYNEHDPLSDIIKNVLEETSEKQPIATEKTESIEADSSVENANIFEYNLEFDDDGNEITSENITSVETQSNDSISDSETDTGIVTDAIISDNTNNDISETESSLPEENTVEETMLNDAELPSDDTAAINSKENLTIESAIEAAIESSIENDSSCSSTSGSLLEKLEDAKNNHFHDRTDLNSMIDLDFKYVNVYERIVQDKLLDYMKKFDMCMCDRCIVDTFALAVTELPTKIVVVDKNEVFPLINFFEVKNTAIISTALIKACMIVKEKPHHK